MTNAEREAKDNNEECRANNPSPTVPVLVRGFIPGVPIKLVIWVSKVGHLKLGLESRSFETSFADNRQLAAGGWVSDLA